jgi:curved DNA-binding protein CbpA
MADGANDPYAVLGVARSAAQAEIKAAYQAQVRRYHPDLHQKNPLEDLAKERMIEINAAYELLSDPQARAKHDAGFGAWMPRGGASERRSPTGPGGWKAGRLGWGILVIAMLPLALRVVVPIVRGLRLLLGRLFGQVAAIGGGRVAAAIVATGVVVLVIVWRKRRGTRRR